MKHFHSKIYTNTLNKKIAELSKLFIDHRIIENNERIRVMNWKHENDFSCNIKRNIRPIITYGKTYYINLNMTINSSF
jgi:hypothetical protein